MPLGERRLLVRAADPFVCRVLAADDVAVWQLLALRWRDAAGVWHEAGPVELIGQDGNAVKLMAGAGELSLRADGPDLQLEWTVPSAAWVGLELAAGPDEHFLGLGERFDAFDQRGREVDLRVINGASGGLAYKPVPFYMSSAGYGLHIEGSARSTLRLACPDDPARVTIRSDAPALRLHILPGASLKEILCRYAGLAGRPAVPPAWVFGPWKSRDWTAENTDTVLEDVEQGRRLGLAGTVKLIDAAWQSHYQSLLFDPQRFPDAQAMIERIHHLGYRLVVWVAPWQVRDAEPSETYRYCAEHGFFPCTPAGEPYVHRLGNSPTFLGSCLDFTNREAIDWWQANIRRLVRMGVDGFKTDFGEQVPLDAVFHDGRSGRELHNLYPYLYNRATYEAMQGETDGVLLGRSAWHGSQSLSAIWAGDQSSDFGPATGLPSAIIAGQAAGLSGFPFWASDIGGYFGTPTDEVYQRWTQFGAFSPIMQVHGLGNARTLALQRRDAGHLSALRSATSRSVPVHLYAGSHGSCFRPAADARPGARISGRSRGLERHGRARIPAWRSLARRTGLLRPRSFPSRLPAARRLA